MSHFKLNRTLQIAIHATAWVLMFIWPLFAFGQNESITLGRYFNFCIGPLSFLIVFYLNYFLLINRLLFRKRLGQFVLWNVVLIAGVVLMQDVWHDLCHLWFPELANEVHHGGDHGGPPSWFFITWNALMLILTVGLGVAIRMTANWYRSETEKQEIEKERTQAELRNLKSQLNPHFLFNTLNNIYALIQLDPNKAQYAVHSLSHLMRYVLYDNNQQTIALGQEFAFMKNYIELMSLRLAADQVDLTVDIPDDDGGREVAPLLFISLIENAFKHGVSSTEKSFIHIVFHFADPSTLVCTIKNSDFPKDDHDRSGSGIGLSNLRRRLNLLYPNRHILRTERMEGCYFSQLILNL